MNGNWRYNADGLEDEKQREAHAKPGSFAITPTPEMVSVLKRDYQAMTGMIFGEVPDFADVLEATRMLESVINQQG